MKRGEQRVRLERARFQLGMELHADEPGMVGAFDDLRQQAVGRHAGEPQAVLLEPVAIVDVDLVAVAVALGDRRRRRRSRATLLPGSSTAS